jgi:hypothetical protein
MYSFSSYQQYSSSKNSCNYQNVGAQGPQGFKGPQGATGPKGPQGSTGAQGAIGSQGYCCVGATGAKGPQGSQGPGGGPIGPTGPTGPPGSGYVINTINSGDILTLQTDLNIPAFSFLFTGLNGSGPTNWALSWGISEGLNDPTNQFYITFVDNSTLQEYSPIIYNQSNPYLLTSNSNYTSGSANDFIQLDGTSTYNVNIYQTSINHPGDQPTFTISVTLISV